MKQITLAECEVSGIRSESPPQVISINEGDLKYRLSGSLGPRGILPTAADLLDLSLAIYQIERMMPSQVSTNPAKRIALSIRMRNPGVWNSRATKTVSELLHLLGNAIWTLEFKSGRMSKGADYDQTESRPIEQVVLLSGGMDSACGLASLSKRKKGIQPASFYSTHQRTLQRKIASSLDFYPPTQMGIKWGVKPGKNKSFYYRSFLFLSLGAIVAKSYGAKHLTQFENGVLASAIPPSANWLMTKHAHPRLHQLMADLLSQLFGDKWIVDNPFLHKTKRECVIAAMSQVSKRKVYDLLGETETCWYHWSNHVTGGRKKPGQPCGICIPCIVRRTASTKDDYRYDLLTDGVRNNQKLGRAFRSYYGFLERIREVRHSEGRFFALLPAAGRDLTDVNHLLSLEDLQRLFTQFSDEFMRTFKTTG